MTTKAVASLLLASLLSLPALAQTAPAPPAPPRPSPMAKVEQAVGVAKVTVQYSRPGVKGRQIFGGLVPWGEVWRTGANEATTLELSEAATVAGKPVPAGRYGLFTIPKADSWTVILSRKADQWGSGTYTEGDDALRADVKPYAVPATERFEIRFTEVDDNQATVELRWAEVGVSFPIVFATRDLALAQARAFAAKATAADARPLSAWASWMLASGTETGEAEAWAAKLAAENDAYRYHALHARLAAKNGKFDAARAAADKANTRATGEDAKLPGVSADNTRLQEERATWKK